MLRGGLPWPADSLHGVEHVLDLFRGEAAGGVDGRAADLLGLCKEGFFLERNVAIVGEPVEQDLDGAFHA